MFPNFRLMIAAAFASVVALVAGFGVFATFHVSHQPLVRLPSANPPLQLLRADYAATLPITAAEPFEHRFRVGEPVAGLGISALAYAAIQPNDQPVMKAVTPAADDQEHDAAAPDRAPSPVDREDAPAPAQQAPVAEAAPDAKPGQAAPDAKPDEAATADAKPDEATPETRLDPTDVEAISAEPPPSAASAAAVEPVTAEPPPEPPRPAEQTTEIEIAPGSSTIDSAQAPTFESVAKVAQRKTKRTRVAAKAHRPRRPHTAVSAAAQGFRPNSTFAASTFQTAAQAWPPPVQRQPAKGPRSKATAEATADFAVGGPLVSAPSR